MFLSETLVDINKIVDLCAKSDYFAVNKVGRGGGLAVMWKQTVVCNVVDSSNNHINVMFF